MGWESNVLGDCPMRLIAAGGLRGAEKRLLYRTALRLMMMMMMMGCEEWNIFSYGNFK